MKYILGNWKLNKNLKEVQDFFRIFNKHLVKSNKVVYGVAPTYLSLACANKLKKGQTNIIAQDVCEKVSGSCTGQVGINQLKDLKIKYCIVGHSETRQYLGCTDEIVNKKVLTCLANNIKPIICIGESLIQYNKKQTKQVLAKQLKTIMKNVSSADMKKCIIAYEPLWAIGSGKTPTNKEITNIAKFIKQTIKTKVPVLYGGSVNEENAQSIINLPYIDGSLIGGASLCPNGFAKIIKGVCHG